MNFGYAVLATCPSSCELALWDAESQCGVASVAQGPSDCRSTGVTEATCEAVLLHVAFYRASDLARRDSASERSPTVLLGGCKCAWRREPASRVRGLRSARVTRRSMRKCTVWPIKSQSAQNNGSSPHDFMIYWHLPLLPPDHLNAHEHL